MCGFVWAKIKLAIVISKTLLLGGPQDKYSSTRQSLELTDVSVVALIMPYGGFKNSKMGRREGINIAWYTVQILNWEDIDMTLVQLKELVGVTVIVQLKLIVHTIEVRGIEEIKTTNIIMFHTHHTRNFSGGVAYISPQEGNSMPPVCDPRAGPIGRSPINPRTAQLWLSERLHGHQISLLWERQKPKLSGSSTKQFYGRTTHSQTASAGQAFL